MLCSEVSTVNRNSKGGQAAILKCRRWSCDICYPDLRWKVIRLARDGVPDKFITLTCNPAQHNSPDEAAQQMVAGFRELIKRIRKKWPKHDIQYFRVFERHKSGYPHLHILMRAPFMPQTWLSQQWKEITGAFIVDIRFPKTKDHVAYYVTKYIGKALEKFKGAQRWFRSRKYNEAKSKEKTGIRFGNYWSKHEGKPHLVWWRLMQDAIGSGAIFEVRRWGYARWSLPLVKDP